MTAWSLSVSIVPGLLLYLPAPYETAQPPGMTGDVLKTPKGTRDYAGKEAEIRRETIDKIVGIFRLYNATEIETPVFELRALLLNKYGEDTKLIYNLEDQQGELCSLRYDLTVPFARYMAANSLQKLKRYQIGKVYRRDQPAMTKGRHREFYQCDFDIAGTGPSMAAETECLSVLCRILDTLAIGQYTVLVNHRGLLDCILEECAIAEDARKTVLSSIDKLDKIGWEGVRLELSEHKKIPAEKVDLLQSLLASNQTLAQMQSNGFREKSDNAGTCLASMERLFVYLRALGLDKNVLFEPTLARGLDYYTGLIFEAVLQGKDTGSIAGGGRYDRLVGQLSGKQDVPCVGFSVGIERLFSLLLQAAEAKKEQTVCVVAVGTQDATVAWAMQAAECLHEKGIRADLSFGKKYLTQIQKCEKEHVRVAVVVGETETAAKKLQVKNIENKEDKDRLVALEDLPVAVLSALQAQ